MFVFRMHFFSGYCIGAQGGGVLRERSIDGERFSQLLLMEVVWGGFAVVSVGEQCW